MNESKATEIWIDYHKIHSRKILNNFTNGNKPACIGMVFKRKYKVISLSPL